MLSSITLALKVLNITGIWKFSKKRDFFYSLYTKFIVFSFFIIFVLLTVNIAQATDVVEINEAFIFATSFILVIYKFYLFLHNKNQIQALINKLNNDLLIANSLEESKREKKYDRIIR